MLHSGTSLSEQHTAGLTMHVTLATAFVTYVIHNSRRVAKIVEVLLLRLPVLCGLIA